MTVDDAALDALRAHFHGGSPRQYRRPRHPEVRTVLHVTALATEPFEGDLRIATDGASNINFPSGAAAAVASTGHILLGWFEDPALPFGDSGYAELQGVRLAYRLAVALPGVPAIVCDVESLVRRVLAVGNSEPRPGRDERILAGSGMTQIGCTDHAPVAEVAAAARSGRAVLQAQPHGAAQKHRSAVGPLEGVAHRLAWTAARMLRDGIDPAGEWDYLMDVACRRTLNEANIVKAYQARRRGGIPPARRYRELSASLVTTSHVPGAFGFTGS